jgi:hypothetical protein
MWAKALSATQNKNFRSKEGRKLEQKNKKIMTRSIMPTSYPTSGTTTPFCTGASRIDVYAGQDGAALAATADAAANAAACEAAMA